MTSAGHQLWPFGVMLIAIAIAAVVLRVGEVQWIGLERLCRALPGA
jgi:hypothetical protein